MSVASKGRVAGIERVDSIIEVKEGVREVLRVVTAPPTKAGRCLSKAGPSPLSSKFELAKEGRVSC